MKNAYNTSAYGSFAYVYDIFMDNVPYEEWAQFILNLLQDRKITEGKGDSR